MTQMQIADNDHAGMIAQRSIAAHTQIPQAGLLGDDVAAYATIGTVMTCSRKQTLFWEGDSVDSVFKVLRGTLCLYTLLPDGRRQISRFCHAGDLIGLNGSNTHTYSAEALTEVAVTRIRRSELEAHLDIDPELRRSVMATMKDELCSAQTQLLALGRKSALERVATFLTAMSEQAIRQGGVGDVIELPMTRIDIADYLGLTQETVCRVLGQLKKHGIVSTSHPHRIEIFQQDLLQDLAEDDESANNLS